uniref:Uncharacterized protein n=1 Tax=Oryza nivara TaxID=4536 RepID=A0A0E0I9W4_ORYNI
MPRPTTRSVAPAVAARLRAAPETPPHCPPLEDRLRGRGILPTLPPPPDVLASKTNNRRPVHDAELLRVDCRLGLGQRHPRCQCHGRLWQAVHLPQPPLAAAAH